MRREPIPFARLLPRWGRLVDTALEQARFLSTLEKPSDAHRIDEAALEDLYRETATSIHGLLGMQAPEQKLLPELRPTGRLDDLAKRLKRFYLPWTLMALLFLLFTLPAGAVEPSAWLARGFVVILFFLPLLWFGVMKKNIPPAAVINREANGRRLIECELATRSRAQASLAMAYARILFDDLHGHKSPPWKKHGWCRLVQRRLAETMRSEGNDEAMLYEVIEDILEELGGAVTVTSKLMGLGTPAEVRCIKKRFAVTSLGSFLTGKPLVDMQDFMVRSFGTAVFSLASEEWDAERLLKDPYFPDALFPDPS